MSCVLCVSCGMCVICHVCHVSCCVVCVCCDVFVCVVVMCCGVVLCVSVVVRHRAAQYDKSQHDTQHPVWCACGVFRVRVCGVPTHL